jgi:hypothetical protein
MGNGALIAQFAQRQAFPESQLESRSLPALIYIARQSPSPDGPLITEDGAKVQGLQLRTNREGLKGTVCTGRFVTIVIYNYFIYFGYILE